MIFYTVHENREAADEDQRIELVKQGFNWLGLVSPLLWCLYRLEWRGFLAYLVALLVLFGFLGVAGAGEDTLTLAGLGLNLLVGFFANDWRRAMLARRGYRLLAVVGGANMAEAELKFFRERGAAPTAKAPGAPAPPARLAGGEPWAMFPTSQGLP